ncbi:branched-chain amino acid transport system substrate-binding protein [Azospirillum agricola]|uniref:ABC transporter substrate-binding protein n=1 Tax=Azospirillum agricola TaxID=1720247 RepID=UPI001AEB68CE|nr:ABC transporter substrate-binding protein [Azospirillum agricola]MBP2231247.1 branched-chain amino acid transport system substrate-binding protein [Azospirillum agricola]
MTRWILAAGVSALALVAGAAQAEISDGKVRIAVLNDMTGPYADPTGMGSVEAVRMAVEEMGGKVAGKPVEIIFADHQNKPDIGAALVTKWIDTEQVDVIVDVPTSSVALAVQEITKQKNRVFLISGGGAAQLTGTACSPTTAHWTYDTYALAQGMGTAGVKQLGDTWYFMTVDYAFGHALEKDVSEVLKANAGTVVGAVRHPLNTADFSSFLLQAQGSKAKVIALANAGADTANSIKQAQEFGIPQGGQTLASLLMFPTDIHSLGLPAAQGLVLMDGWNPERDDDSRAFAKAYTARTGRMPSMIQTGNYSAVRHYLKAIEATGSDEAKTVMAKMRETPVNDAFAKGGTLRADGRMVHDMYLMQVKSPAESKGPWDYTKVLSTIPGNQAYRPLDKGGCPLVK